MKYSKDKVKEIQDKILEYITEGNTVRDSIKASRISTSTFYGWLESNEEFAKQYARAMEIGIEGLMDDIIDIADDRSDDYITKNGVEVFNPENVKRARLKIDSRKWLITKRLPKKYGDRTDITTNGESVNTPVNINWGVIDSEKK